MPAEDRHRSGFLPLRDFKALQDFGQGAGEFQTARMMCESSARTCAF